jgi:penicillin-binding protein 1A
MLRARWLGYSVLVLLTMVLVAIGVFALAIVLVYPNLPSLEALTDYRPKVPLQVFAEDGTLIGEFGEERRAVVKVEKVPKLMKQAILAAEDDRFYEHRGVDYHGVMRAAFANFAAGGVKEGASTITMQVARTFLLSNERTFMRKLREMLLALKIERNLSKDQILELYINQIFLGQRAYGFGAASQIYYGKSLEQLSLAESAMLAGLPKAPSRFNPVVNPQRAALRQKYVLRRMNELGSITAEQLAAAAANPGKVVPQSIDYHVKADYVAEMARQYVLTNYGDKAYTSGYRVYTTLSPADQAAANAALRRGALDYDRRHGYRGPEAVVQIAPGAQALALEEALAEREAANALLPAVVLEASPSRVSLFIKGGEEATISGEGLKFVQRALFNSAPAKQRLVRGAIVRVTKNQKGAWEILQRPSVEAALIALSPKDGRVRALVGGFDFASNKFNHVTQALRQPGSSFKPFIYSAALERDFTPSTVLEDAPFLIDADKTGGELWEPENYDKHYEGPMRLRVALARSKNMVSIRVIDAIGTRYAQEYVTKFGFDPKLNPAVLTLALGAGQATPLQVAAGYAVFANQGFRISPYFIDRIEDANGKVLMKAQPKAVDDGAEQVLDPRNAFLMTSMMKDVIRVGTAHRAVALGRRDLAGKTGTSNESRDAWFAGYNSEIVAVSWIGFDTPASLGEKETGAQAALPIWMAYMGEALKGVPERKEQVPDGVIIVPVNPASGRRDPEAEDRIAEYFYRENIPPLEPPKEVELQSEGADHPPEDIKEQLY